MSEHRHHEEVVPTNEDNRTISERAERHVQVTQRYIRVLATVVAIILLVSQAITNVYVILGANKQAENNRTQLVNQRILVECTTPGNPQAVNPDDRVHECFDATQARTGEAVSIIKEAGVYAAACATTGVVGDAIKDCVDQKIQKSLKATNP